MTTQTRDADMPLRDRIDAALINAAQDLLAGSDECQFAGGLGRGAPQQYWDALQDALERGGDE